MWPRVDRLGARICPQSQLSPPLSVDESWEAPGYVLLARDQLKGPFRVSRSLQASDLLGHTVEDETLYSSIIQEYVLF